MTEAFLEPEYNALMNRLSGFSAPASVDAAVKLMRRLQGAPPKAQDLLESTRHGVSRSAVRRSDGTELEVLVATPTMSAPDSVIIAVHGGGLISGSAAGGIREVAPLLSTMTSAVAVEYRLAPESSFTDALSDCVAAVRWVEQHAEDLGDGGPRVFLAGSSAGGALALATAVAVHRNGSPLAGVLLSSPMLDDASNSRSMRQTAGRGGWDPGWNRIGWRASLHDADDRAAVPVRARLEGLPPVFLSVGTADALRDEVMAMGADLADAGVAVELHLWPGAFHGSEYASPHSRLGDAAWRAKKDWLTRTGAGARVRDSSPRSPAAPGD